MTRPRRSSREGELLAGKYRLDALLGAGGMGEVYRAENTMIGRAVAIKVLREEHVENADIVTRFLREARAANIVRHPNVVDVLDIGQDEDGAPFIVQELLEGEDLGTYMESLGGRVPIDAVIDLLLPVMDAVALAHAKGVVHRDLKPENIFLAQVDEKIVPKVLDFGVARISTSDEQRMTAAGAALGTPAYMSPEQINDNRAIDARSDVWALGVILHEVISGDLPFRAETYSGLFVKIATEAPIPLETAVPGVPRELAAIVARCLRHNPAERFAHAGEVAAHLRRLRANGPIAMPPGPIRRSMPVPELAHAPTQLGAGATDARMSSRAPKATVVPDLDLPAPPRTVSSAPRAPLAVPVEVAPLALAFGPSRLSSLRAADAPTTVASLAGFDDDEVQMGSGLAIDEAPARERMSIPPRDSARARAANEAALRRREELAAKERLIGLAVLSSISLVLTGVLATFLSSNGGWPVVPWAAHLNGLPAAMTGAAAVTLLVVGLVSANEGYRVMPISWGLLMTGAGLLVGALATCGFFVSVLPNLAGAAPADDVMRSVFPWATMLVPLGVGAHLFRKALYAWSDDGRTKAIAFAIGVAFAFYAALQIARGAGAPLDPNAGDAASLSQASGSVLASAGGSEIGARVPRARTAAGSSA